MNKFDEEMKTDVGKVIARAGCYYCGIVAGGIGILMWINGIEDQRAMARHLLLIAAIMTSLGALGWEIGDAGRRKD